MAVFSFFAQNSLSRRLYAQLDKDDKRRFLRLIIISQLPALAELAVAGTVALLAAVFNSSEKVADYAPVAFVIKHTGFNFLHDQRYLAFALLLALWFAMAAKNAANALQAYIGAFSSEYFSRKLNLRLMHFFLHAPWSWHLGTGIVDMGYSFSSAGQMGFLLTTFTQLIANASTILFLFAGLLLVAPGLSLGLFLVAGSSALLVLRGAKRYLDTLNRDIFVKQLELSRASYFALHGMKEAKLHRREEAIHADYAARSGALMRSLALRSGLSRLPVALIETIAFLMLPVVMYVLLKFEGASMTKVVAVMGFLAGAAWRVLPAVNRLVDNVIALRSYAPHIYNVLDRLREAELPENRIIIPQKDVALPFAHELRIDHVDFSYPKAHKPALKNIDLTIARGEMMGIVGLSGAGKSTLAALLTGLLQPSKGGISLDGVPITPELHTVWRTKLGYVPQSPFIFNDSIAVNIALSDWGGEIDRERVLVCCKQAALDFIDELEHGIDTIVGDRGMRLSGGQTQRLAIARALYDKPEILIFDEATSSLDMKNERAIHETVLTLRENVTMIIIAHRLSTVQDCDHVIWLENGAVKTAGGAQEVLREYKEALRITSTEALPETDRPLF